MWSLYFSISDKGAKSSKTLADIPTWCPRPKLQVYRKMGPDNNGTKNTVFRSPLVVAYTTSSRQNKDPLYRLVISAHRTVTHIRSIRRTSYPHTVELHLSAAFEEHAQISTSDRALHEYGWIFEPANSVLCREKKENLRSASVYIVRYTSVHHVQRQPLSLGVARTLFDEFNPTCNKRCSVDNLRAYVLSFTDFIFKIFLIPVDYVH